MLSQPGLPGEDAQDDGGGGAENLCCSLFNLDWWIFFLLFFLFFFFFFFLLLDIVELCVRFVFLPPSTVCLCRWWTFYKDLLVSFLPFFRDSLFLTYPRFLLAVCKQKKMTGSSRNV